jgi:hypothetical protein
MIEAPSRNTGNSVCTVVAKSSETRHLGNVGLDRIQALSQRMCRTTNLIPMLVGHYDHCALGREPLRGSKADTARSTADNGYPPIKPAHSGFPFLYRSRRSSHPQANGIERAEAGLTISRQRLCVGAPPVPGDGDHTGCECRRIADCRGAEMQRN